MYVYLSQFELVLLQPKLRHTFLCTYTWAFSELHSNPEVFTVSTSLSSCVHRQVLKYTLADLRLALVVSLLAMQGMHWSLGLVTRLLLPLLQGPILCPSVTSMRPLLSGGTISTRTPGQDLPHMPTSSCPGP